MIRLLLAVAVSGLTPTSSFPAGPVSRTVSHEIPRLDAVAGALAGHHVSVNCWARHDWSSMLKNAVRDGDSRLPEAAAFTNMGAHQIQIGPDTCRLLANVMAHRPVGEVDEANAVLVLAHESMHAHGIGSESEAECRGMGAMPKAARLLGVPSREGVRLQRIFRGTSYPLDEPDYRSPSCPYGKPGIVVPNVFGPDESVAHLSAGLRRVAGVLRGWRRAPGPPGKLGPCAATTRQAEVARVEQAYVRGELIAYVVGVQFHSRAQVRAVVARSLGSSRCHLSGDLKQVRRFDSRATGAVSALRIPAAAESDRSVMRSKTFRGGSLYDDSIIVVEPRFRAGYVLVFSSYGAPPPRSAEVAATRAVLH